LTHHQKEKEKFHFDTCCCRSPPRNSPHRQQIVLFISFELQQLNLATSPTELGFCKKFEGNKPSSKDGKTLIINSDLSNERRGI
jgi:hypothetical protein